MAVMGGISSGPAEIARQPLIRQELDRLDKEIANLCESADALHNRIGAILMPEVPTPPQAAGTAEAPLPSVPLAAELRSKADRVRAVRLLIVDILERIEV